MALAQRLSREGHQVDQGRKSVVARADSEDDAHRLSEKAQQYAPSDAEIHAERADTPIYTGEDSASGPMDFPTW